MERQLAHSLHCLLASVLTCTAIFPFCLNPKTRSIHSCIRPDTCSPSSACVRARVRARASARASEHAAFTEGLHGRHSQSPS